MTTTNATKRGRPPYDEGQPRRVGVNLTIREDILEQVDRIAEKHGVSRSALINELLSRVIPQ